MADESDPGFCYSVDTFGKKLDFKKDEDVQKVVEEIKACKNLTSIRLSNTSVSIEAAKAIADAIAEHYEIEIANFSDCFTGRLLTEIPQAVASFGEALMNKQNLKVIDFSDNAFGPVGARAVHKLISHNINLEELRFVNNGLGTQGGQMMASAIETACDNAEEAGRDYGLKTFKAGRNRLEDLAATELAESFKMCPHLKEVAMPQNGTTKVGFVALFAAFAGKDMEIINMNDNTATEVGAKAVAEAIRTMKNLQKIDLGDCMLREEGCIAVCEAIQQSGNTGLKSIDMAFADIEEEQAENVADAMALMLRTQTELESFRISGNEMEDDEVLERLYAVLDTTVGREVLVYEDEE
ncbi:hypothetical protein SARC_07045 [Sphaeroforma arctica JP610]|uniref:Ran GTPase-activating protein 1 n=1 Tax=Sphaeroforma arctica JP610 TaxID=667725 RepID=A0A0L0FVM7_9EUKA|nr:hypothetical protein SARC_07045 [Sphaeroforma arctica JP610]KNC80591.1 hypothetical protein SARC_07045 [Sphaeroforma arctica JP610]|eukprot:XP_014154493.1 hypothetical protein SARC_07045 [Sphaeroforma arctica JP610]